MKSFTLALAAVATAVKVQGPTEEDACACLPSSGATIYFPTSCVDDAYTLYHDEDGNEIEYPWDYGVGQCAAHDEGLEGFGCDGEDASGFCAEPWCYVSEECAEFDDVTASDVVEGAFYSYKTCGGDGDAQSAADIAAAEAEAKIGGVLRGRGDPRPTGRVCSGMYTLPTALHCTALH